MFTAAQLDFSRAIVDIRAAQQKMDSSGELTLASAVADYLDGGTDAAVAHACGEHAVMAVRAWWALSDDLMLRYSPPSLTYPAWWVNSSEVGFADGPPPSPDVPPPPTGPVV